MANKEITLNVTEEVRDLIYAALMSYGNSLSEMAKKIPNEPDIESKLIEKSEDAWFLARDIKDLTQEKNKNSSGIEQKISDFNIDDWEEEVQQFINNWILLQSNQELREDDIDFSKMQIFATEINTNWLPEIAPISYGIIGTQIYSFVPSQMDGIVCKPVDMYD